MGTTKPTVFVRSPIFSLNSCYPLGLKLCISRKAVELHTNLPLPVGTTISTTRYHHFANQNGRQVNSEIFSLVPHPKLRPFRKYSYTSSILTSSGLYFLGLNSRTYELLVPLMSVQQPIMSGAYLIGPLQLLCVPKVKLPRLSLLGELFFEVPETTDTKLLCILFARNKSSGCRWVRTLFCV